MAKKDFNAIFQLTRTVTAVGASASGTVSAGAKGVFFRCTAGTATITPNGGGTVNLDSSGQAIYNFDYTPAEIAHGAIDYTTASGSALEITEDR